MDICIKPLTLMLEHYRRLGMLWNDISFKYEPQMLQVSRSRCWVQQMGNDMSSRVKLPKIAR